MAGERCTQEGHSIQDVVRRLGITTKSLYNWRTRYGANTPEQPQEGELRRLKAELKRFTQKRDILKEVAVFFANESEKNTRLYNLVMAVSQ